MDFPNQRLAHDCAERSGCEPRGRPPEHSAQAITTPESLADLQREWRRLYHRAPPRLSRDLLMRGVGYRRQELDHGGLSKATRRRLKTLVKMFRTEGRVAPDPGLSLKPGARLVREWRGRTHTVTVTEDGFDYAGATYPSLTKVAREITGAHWSGPRFFGLKPAAGRRSQGDRRG
jgi:hypothetical protein